MRHCGVLVESLFNTVHHDIYKAWCSLNFETPLVNSTRAVVYPTAQDHVQLGLRLLVMASSDRRNVIIWFALNGDLETSLA